MTTRIDKHNALSPSEPPAKSTHPFARYFRKHQHYPRIKLDNGVQKLTIEFCPGYMRISTSHPFGGEVYITRSTALHAIRRMVPIARQWQKSPHADFDVPRQQVEYARAEEEHSQALRAEKRDRQIETPDPERQRRRWEKAKARANRQS